MNNRFNGLDSEVAEQTARWHALMNAGAVIGCSLFGFASLANAQLSGPTYTTIDPPGSVFTLGVDINAGGQIVGRYIDAAGINHGFLLSGGAYTDITFPGGAVYTRALGINRQGDIVGDYSLIDPNGVKGVHGYLLHQGTFTSFDFPGADETVAQGIDRNGGIVGYYTDSVGANGNGTGVPASSKHHGFLLSAGMFTSVDFPGSGGTDLWKINDFGEVVGRYLGTTDEKFHVFTLIDGSFTQLGDYPGALQTATVHIGGLNSRGAIVSDYLSGTGTYLDNIHGFLLSGGVYTSIDFPGAIGTISPGINDSGVIVGAYVAPDGTIHGYVRNP